MRTDEFLAEACEPVPGLLEAALALLPEGLLIGSVGLPNSFAGEPLVRAAARCLSADDSWGAGAFVEHVFVSQERLVVIRRGQRHPCLALVFVCNRDTNLQFVLHAARRASLALEANVDWAVWEG